MDKTTLILIMAGLLALLVVLVAVYVIMGRSNKTEVSSEAAITFESMCSIINRSSTSNAQLNHAVDTIIGRYSHISDFEVYGTLLEKLCIHPNTDSKVILRFQKALITANPKYKEQIEKRLKLGLSERK